MAEASDADGRVYLLGVNGGPLHAGRRVRRFNTAEELLGAPLDGPGCVVIDLEGRGADGLEVQAALATRELPPPVVFLTGGADAFLSIQAMKAGAIDVLPRPFDEALLREAVARGVRQHSRALRDGRDLIELRRRHDGLTPREREVMELVTAGLANKVVGTRLGICEKTVKAHRGAVMRKMQADS